MNPLLHIYIYSGHTKTLDQFTYSDSDINEVIFDCMGKSSIQGVTGKRSFPDGIYPDGLVKIDRVQGWAFITVYVCQSM